MAKLPNSGDFKLDLPGARRPKVEASPQPVAAPSEASQPAAKQARTSVPAGAKSLTFYPSKDAWLQLRMLSGRLDRPAQDLLLDALDALFREHNLPPIARGVGEKNQAA
jgi:hypothetical protein